MKLFNKVILFVITFSLLGCTNTEVKDQRKEAYSLLQSYYATLEEITSLDDLIGMEALNIESDDLAIPEGIINSSSSASLAKGMIALTLHGDSTKEYIPILEGYVHENGAIDAKNDSTYANLQVYGIYGLYLIDSNQLDLACDYLVSLQNEDGSFSISTGEDADITGWCIEALALVDQIKYKETIDLAIDYLESIYHSPYYEGGYGGNADTQCSVLYGLLEADYEIEDEAIDYILTFENKDGTFYSPTTGQGKNNSYTTSEVAKFLGNYYNGNILKKAREQYEEIN